MKACPLNLALGLAIVVAVAGCQRQTKIASGTNSTITVTQKVSGSNLALLTGQGMQTQMTTTVAASNLVSTNALSTNLVSTNAVSTNPPPPLILTNLNGPRIEFESRTHDFQKITGGDVVKCEFIFTNIGPAALEVTDVRPGCGCTTTGPWTKQVEPGKTGVIPLQFNSSNFSGPVTKDVTVTCNDPGQPTVILRLKANIWRPIDVSPQFAIVNLTREAPSNAAIVRILNNLKAPLMLSNIESKNPAFEAELNTVQPGKEFQLIIKTVPPFPTSTTQGQVTIQTSATNMPLISVVAWANMQETVLAMPAQLTLPPAPLASNFTQTVWVRNLGSNDIVLSDPVITVEGATVDLKDFQKGRYFQLIVTFPQGMSANPNQPAELRVKTSHPNYPVLKVPVMQQPRQPN